MKRKPLKGVESVFDLKDTHPEKHVVPDPEQAALKSKLEKALKETFPASDTVSVLQPTTIGPKKQKRA
ncbi:MAG: hypothetical protein LCH38_13715 [Proteobacteria bacterium]|nr:hypothetical protein [Pseudomonadota bacterium]